MDIITFTKVTMPFGWLGNMYPSKIKYMDDTYRTSEALFQCLRFENYPKIQDIIRNQLSPIDAKKVARHYIEELQYDANNFKDDIENMKLCLKLKVEQHPKIKIWLLDTGDSKIIEDCTYRRNSSGYYWGMAFQNGCWNGQNILGNLWMDLREELRNDVNDHDIGFEF